MLNILVVDDDRIIRAGLKSIISSRESEFTVVGDAPNGLRALEMIKELKPDILITDIKMPVMDGVELINNIRSLEIDIKIIVLSGFDDYKYVRNTLKSGAVDYLLKPINNDVLLELLDKLRLSIDQEKLEKEKLEQFNSELAESSKVFKEKLFNKLLNSNAEALSHEFSRFKDFLQDDQNSFTLLLLAKDDFYIDMKKGYFNPSAYFEEVKDNIYNYLINTGWESHCMLTEKEDQYIVLLIKAKTMGNDSQIIAKSIAENIKSTAASYSITAAISPIYDNFNNTPQIYEKTKELLETRFYQGKNIVLIDNSHRSYYSHLATSAYDTVINDIINRVELCDSLKLKYKINELMDMFYKAKIFPPEIRSFLLDLTYRISIVAGDFKQALGIFTEKDEELSFYIENINTFSELKLYMGDAFYNILEHMKLIRSERSKKIIEKAKAYIGAHYTEELSLKSIADKVYLNPNYFSELFRNEVGVNFIDYLIETRINAAKELLKRPGIKVYEVAEQIGYKEIVSFNRAFKKVVGVSPKEYIALIK